VKWSIDWFLNNFFFFVKQLVFIFSKVFLNSLSKPVDYLFKGVSAIFVFLLFGVTWILTKLSYYLSLLYSVFLVPSLRFVVGVVDGFFPNVKPLSRFYLFNYYTVNFFFGWVYHLLVFVFTKSYKWFIDLVFFDIPRSNLTFKKLSGIFWNFLFYFTLVYLLFYQNIWGYLFNYLFFDFLESFIVWDITTYTGVLYIFLSFLNLDNLFLFIYIIFSKVGISFILNHTWHENFLAVWNFWEYFYVSTQKATHNNSFFRVFIDTVLSNLSTTKLVILDIDFNSTPIFFYFGSLFFFTVILSWLFFSYLGLYGIFKLNIITLFLFWVSLLFSAKSIFVSQKVYIIKLCSWVFLSTNFRLDYYFLIDTISFSFMLLTTTIAFFVFIYAFSYFRYEPLVDRFLLFILSFVISMIFLVTSGNTIMLFLGWELIGFTSFCLINFWTTKAATLKSAFKAFTFNKVSDFFMFMFLVSTFSVYYTFDILSINQQVYKYEFLVVYLFGTPINFLEFVALMIIGAAFIKSAQFGGHAWLPDSMEAPVPASSLIHSATLVSAGVYLILRFNFIFDSTQYSKFIIPVIGSLTAAYGGVCAAAQSDIKKTLAYSTISHCGFLMVLCATEMNEFTILYLYVHGFFKAGVFMCVGNVLRITRGYQDTRRMGGLLKYLPFEYFCAIVGVLNLAGLPFTFGFFIKHLLLISLDTHIYIYYFVMFHSLVGAFSGLFYSYRIINYTFGDFKKGQKVLYSNLNRNNYNSLLYTNSSLAATLSVFFLFIFSYLITYFMFKYFMASNYIFSDYMNTTTLTNYYATVNSFNGYLLNFSYINLTVVSIFTALFFSRYRKIPRYYIWINTLMLLVLLFSFSFYFFFIL
jgi:NADH:ubiquinone oxidoreductase subunit 5 (subunit L)/multisubunit Na+/H+ antiporter MnhA subunit